MPKIIGSHKRLKRLEENIRSLAPVMVSYSGGMDSSFLLWACSRVLPPEDVVAVTCFSPTTPAAEIRDARSTAAMLKVQHHLYPGPEMQNEEFLVNDLLRCYYCKRERFNFLLSLNSNYPGFRIIEGSVRDDLEDYRPGMRALTEAGIISPLLEAGLSKADIKIIAGENHLTFAGKKSESCLATRIITGQRIEIPVLEQIQTSEQALHDLGFHFVRVRCNGGEARLEFIPEDMERAFNQRNEIIRCLRESGFDRVALDLEGYKVGKGKNKNE